MLHGIHCIQSCCIISTAFKMFHFFTLHGIHCIQSGCILPRCMEYTAFNLTAWNPLHSIGMLWAMLQKIHCNQSGCIGPRCMDSTALLYSSMIELAYLIMTGSCQCTILASLSRLSNFWQW